MTLPPYPRRAAIHWRSAGMALALCLPAAAQWDTLHGAAGATVTQAAFHVVAEMPTMPSGVFEFSAMGLPWLDLGPGYVLGTGDWTMLMEVAGVNYTYRGYSARYHDYSDIGFDGQPQAICVEDDVILLVGPRQGEFQACGFSAQTRTWDCVPIGTAFTHACSRFVLGVADQANAYGFAARTGSWAPPVPVAMAAYLTAEGNVLLLDDPSTNVARTFSGVRGEWSPPMSYLPAGAPQIAHNVAWLRSPGGPAGVGIHRAYSAYAGAWVPGGAIAAAVHLSDNVVVLEQAGTALLPSAFRAFGARPATSWAPLSLPAGHAYTLRFAAGRDWVIVEDETADELHAFSGVAGGAFTSRGISGGVTGFRAQKTYAIAANAAGDVHAYSAPTGLWAPVFTPTAPVVYEDQGVYAMVVDAAYNVHVYSSRSGQWDGGPTLSPAYAFAYGGAVACAHNAVTYERTWWHEHTGTWNDSPGPMAPPTFLTGRNQMLLDHTAAMGPVAGISAQRGDLIEAPWIPPGGVVTDSWSGQNVACVEVDYVELHAFGSANATHSYFQYPLDSEFAAFTAPAAPTVPAVLTVRDPTAVGALVLLLVGLDPPPTPVPLPPLGLCGDLHVIFLDSAFAGVIGPNGLLTPPYPYAISTPVGVYLGAFDVLFQGVTFGACVTAVGPTAELARYH